MRKVVLSAGISLDGYIARADGGVDFLFMPKGFSMASFFATVDTEVMGRKTLQAALRMSGGSLPDSTMARYVFSRSHLPGNQSGCTFVQQSPARFINQLRKRRGKDLWLMGGGELAREFLKADLVDEIHLGVIPVLLGAGIPLFPGGFPQRDFRLIDNKAYSKGMVFLKYRRARAKAKKKAA